ncbi:MAG: protein kinase domain-containing protein, partial [Chloroflexota bacterium]
MAENICPQCGARNNVTARFCNECGTPLLSGPGAPSGPARLSQPQVTIGSILEGRYRIEHELGRGGFGAVYKAWDLRLSKAVAVKENLDASVEAQRQFTREATVLANLSHQNLPRVIDHFTLNGMGQYLVMDFVDGEDLNSLVGRQGMAETLPALSWIGQVAEALVYLHGQRPPILHRDIKPANIRITPQGRAMLVDFGLVKTSEGTTSTTVGARAITPGYAPPEQYGMGHTDVRTDLYALGATLYTLLTGREPPESVQRMTGKMLTPASQLNPRVPERLSRAIEQVMSLDPNQRYQSAGELLAELHANLVGM